MRSLSSVKRPLSTSANNMVASALCLNASAISGARTGDARWRGERMAVTEQEHGRHGHRAAGCSGRGGDEAITLHGGPITFVVRAVVRVHGEFALCFKQRNVRRVGLQAD